MEYVPDRPKTTVATTPVCDVLSTKNRASDAKKVNAICAHKVDYWYCCCSLEQENPEKSQLHKAKQLCG
jgi:hypothetical protein